MERKKRSVYQTIFQIGLGILFFGLFVDLILHSFFNHEMPEWTDWLKLTAFFLLGFINIVEGLGYSFTKFLKKVFRIKSED